MTDDAEFVALIAWLLDKFGSVGMCDRGWWSNDIRIQTWCEVTTNGGNDD